jgi:hypothetical protein
MYEDNVMQTQTHTQSQPAYYPDTAVIGLTYQMVIQGRRYTGTIENISLNGAFLTHPGVELTLRELADVGAIEIVFNLETLALKCEAVYTSPLSNKTFPAGIAVVFCDLDAATNHAVAKLTALVGRFNIKEYLCSLEKIPPEDF